VAWPEYPDSGRAWDNAQGALDEALHCVRQGPGHRRGNEQGDNADDEARPQLLQVFEKGHLGHWRVSGLNNTLGKGKK
jgi:hypothetical protein